MSSKNPWESPDDKDPWKKSSPGTDFPFDVIDNLKKKFNKMSGGSGKKTPSHGYLSLVLAGFAILYLASGLYQVQHNERGVVLRFGRWVRTVGPGLQYILPYPFEEVILQRVTNVNQIDIGSFFNSQQEESLMLTGDSNLANISFSVLWKIKEDGVEDYLFNAKSPDVTVRAVAESVMREIVGQALFSFVQTEGRAEIQQKVRESLQALMNEYKMGIEILRVELQRVEPPASVIDSFRDVERAQAEQQSEKNKAEAYDRDTRARTRGIVAETINNGEARKREIVQIAQGEIARFLSAYSQYKLAPDVVSKRLYIDTMRDIYRSVNKIIIDDNVNAVSYLPLTEIAKNKIKSQNQKETQS
ncbi:MAG: FtsH protease activity modulator HflK [Holosporaceae bacterium]|jgi:membrane protease subunit HflK|nr:FtsH protease activity modulator HflK [Holosporaceae bacterium]